MTLSQLEILIALVEAGSFTKAASRLKITQSAVSHALQGLETSLGVTLIDRRTSPQQLTQAGQRLLPHARGILAQTEIFHQESAALKGLTRGTLRIASFGPTSSLRLLPDLLTEFSKHYPGIDLYVDEGPDDIVAQWLTERKAEIGFITLPADDAFDAFSLIEDEYVVLLAANHPLAQKSHIRAMDLNGIPFIMTNAGSRANVEDILTSAGARPHIAFRLPQILSILGIVQCGFAVSVAARLALPNEPAGVVYRPLFPSVPRQVGIAALSGAELSPGAHAFISIAHTLAERWSRERTVTKKLSQGI